MLQGDALHTYITHPKRLLVHFCSIKFLSYIPAVHHSGKAEELGDFSCFNAKNGVFSFPHQNLCPARSCTIQYD